MNQAMFIQHDSWNNTDFAIMDIIQTVILCHGGIIVLSQHNFLIDNYHFKSRKERKIHHTNILGYLKSNN